MTTLSSPTENSPLIKSNPDQSIDNEINYTQKIHEFNKKKEERERLKKAANSPIKLIAALFSMGGTFTGIALLITGVVCCIVLDPTNNTSTIAKIGCFAIGIILTVVCGCATGILFVDNAIATCKAL